MEQAIKGIASVIATTFIYFLGEFDVALQSLLIVIVLDYLTGLAKSYVNKSLDSTVGLKGIIKKLCFLILVAVAVVVDNITIGNGIIRTLIIYYLVSNEGLSIIENLGEMNILVPKILKDRLEQLKKDNKGDSK